MNSHWRIQGTRNVYPPLGKIISFSCSFQQKCYKIIGWRTLLRSWCPWEILDPPLQNVMIRTLSFTALFAHTSRPLVDVAMGCQRRMPLSYRSNFFGVWRPHPLGNPGSPTVDCRMQHVLLYFQQLIVMQNFQIANTFFILQPQVCFVIGQQLDDLGMTLTCCYVSTREAIIILQIRGGSDVNEKSDGVTCVICVRSE